LKVYFLEKVDLREIFVTFVTYSLV